jgi:hypothetical protein
MKRCNSVGSFLIAAVLAFGPRVYADALSNQITQLRPVKLGTSGGNLKERGKDQAFCCSGTLGALVKDNLGNFYLLSNDHVFGGHKGDVVTQPGLIDADCLLGPSNAVGTVTTAVNLKSSKNKVDAAIAMITSSNEVDVSGTILGVGQPSAGTYVPALGSVVLKSGRTSGITSGVVAAVDATLAVAGPTKCGSTRLRIRRFINQIVVTPSNFGNFSQGGDSGSLVVDAATNTCPRTAGLLFAGTASATAVNPIDEVLLELGQKLKGATLTVVGCPAPPGPGRLAREESYGLDLPSYKKAAVARTNHENKLLGVAGVVGIGVGRQQDNPSQATVEIFVDKDTPELRAALPSSVDGVPCHVLETGSFVTH